MTALAPQQMRELAANGDERAEDILTRSPGAVHKLTAALRTAADQLDAVQAWVDEHYHHFQEISELDAILTADTADAKADAL